MLGSRGSRSQGARDSKTGHSLQNTFSAEVRGSRAGAPSRCLRKRPRRASVATSERQLALKRPRVSLFLRSRQQKFCRTARASFTATRVAVSWLWRRLEAAIVRWFKQQRLGRTTFCHISCEPIRGEFRAGVATARDGAPHASLPPPAPRASARAVSAPVSRAI